MTTLDHYFDSIADLADRLESSESFDIHLQTFRQLLRDFRRYLYKESQDPVIHDHLDYLAKFDLSPPKRRFIEHFLAKSARDMYGNYQHREKIRDQVRKIAARCLVIRHRLEA